MSLYCDPALVALAAVLLLSGCAERCQAGKTICGGPYPFDAILGGIVYPIPIPQSQPEDQW
jgi:hypothetical protein